MIKKIIASFLMVVIATSFMSFGVVNGKQQDVVQEKSVKWITTYVELDTAVRASSKKVALILYREPDCKACDDLVKMVNANPELINKWFIPMVIDINTKNGERDAKSNFVETLPTTDFVKFRFQINKTSQELELVPTHLARLNGSNVSNDQFVQFLYQIIDKSSK